MDNNFSDKEFISELSRDEKAAFRKLYICYWERLFAYAYNRLHDRESSEGVVQEVFLSIWEKRHELNIHSSLSSYLFGAVKYKIINVMRANEVRRRYAESFTAFVRDHMEPNVEQNQNVRDMETIIKVSLSSLPQKCRLVYSMSRQQHLSNDEIAEELRISKKTVENYLTTALKHLRMNLLDYIKLFVLYFIY